MDLPRAVLREDQRPLGAAAGSCGGGGPFAGGSGGAGQSITFIGATPLGHPLAPILANWLDNHMFVASTLIGFTVMERYPAMKVVVAHGKASWMQEVLEKMEASTRVIPLLHHYPVSTEPEEMWEHGNVMLGFDAEERMIQNLPQGFAGKVVWGSRYRITMRRAPGMHWPATRRRRAGAAGRANDGATRPGNSPLSRAANPRREFPRGVPTGLIPVAREPVYIAESELWGIDGGSQKFRGVPMVRIHLPPAESLERTGPGHGTVYTRFFGYKADVSDAELGRITGADFERAVALLVTIGAGEDEVVIGGASYFVSGSVAAAGRSAELAFTVEEDFQSRGIGSLLMRHIIAIARVKGLDRLEADVLSRNRPMLNVFRRCGLPMAVRHEGDVIHVILSLREAG